MCLAPDELIVEIMNARGDYSERGRGAIYHPCASTFRSFRTETSLAS